MVLDSLAADVTGSLESAVLDLSLDGALGARPLSSRRRFRSPRQTPIAISVDTLSAALDTLTAELRAPLAVAIGETLSVDGFDLDGERAPDR